MILDTLGEHVAANYLTGSGGSGTSTAPACPPWERETYIINY
ncbi:MAG: hypothetical protein ACLT5P_06490 [Flavonifractor plautii]